MTKLETIEKQIVELDPAGRRELLKWLAEYEEQIWDREIEEDLKAGRLDDILEETLADHRAGRTRPL